MPGDTSAASAMNSLREIVLAVVVLYGCGATSAPRTLPSAPRQDESDNGAKPTDSEGGRGINYSALDYAAVLNRVDRISNSQLASMLRYDVHRTADEDRCGHEDIRVSLDGGVDLPNELRQLFALGPPTVTAVGNIRDWDIDAFAKMHAAIGLYQRASSRSKGVEKLAADAMEVVVLRHYLTLVFHTKVPAGTFSGNPDDARQRYCESLAKTFMPLVQRVDDLAAACRLEIRQIKDPPKTWSSVCAETPDDEGDGQHR